MQNSATIPTDCIQTSSIMSSELDITSYVPTNHKNACICLIDIVNFSSWCKDKCPEIIFETMTQFNTFLSDFIMNYTDVDKVELVGDSVLIMGGFRNKFEVHTNVSNIINLTIDILLNIDKIEEMFDIHTSIRIGIHVGNIYSGYIENPRKFQLFGNSINVASRLESYSLPGTFTISAHAFNMIKKEDISTRITEVIGKPNTIALKGVGSVECMMGFLNKKKILIADDDRVCLELFTKICSKLYKLKCVQSRTIQETFKALKENMYVFCIIDLNFIDTCVLDTLDEFRNWETKYRNKRQNIILTTTKIDDTVLNAYIDKIDGYIEKDIIYDHNQYPKL